MTAERKHSRKSLGQASSPWLRPSEIAGRYGIDVGKVLGWIRSGELSAINIASTTSGRPRYCIDPEALKVFERRRSVTTPPKGSRSRRRHKPVDVIEFFLR